MNFWQQPDKFRFRVRDAVHQHGGQISMYNVDGTITVALPAVGNREITMTESLDLMGMEPVTPHIFMPLGTDKPPVILRHIGPGQQAGDDPAYWCYRRFAVAEEV